MSKHGQVASTSHMCQGDRKLTRRRLGKATAVLLMTSRTLDDPAPVGRSMAKTVPAMRCSLLVSGVGQSWLLTDVCRSCSSVGDVSLFVPHAVSYKVRCWSFDGSVVESPSLLMGAMSTFVRIGRWDLTGSPSLGEVVLEPSTATYPLWVCCEQIVPTPIFATDRRLDRAVPTGDVPIPVVLLHRERVSGTSAREVNVSAVRVEASQ